jgi:hypothetical protein
VDRESRGREPGSNTDKLQSTVFGEEVICKGHELRALARWFSGAGRLPVLSFCFGIGSGEQPGSAQYGLSSFLARVKSTAFDFDLPNDRQILYHLSHTSSLKMLKKRETVNNAGVWLSERMLT